MNISSRSMEIVSIKSESFITKDFDFRFLETTEKQ